MCGYKGASMLSEILGITSLYIPSGEKTFYRMKMLLCFALICTALIARTSTGWVNEWDRPLSFQCPSTQYISWVNSEHSNRREDRRWNYG